MFLRVFGIALWVLVVPVLLQAQTAEIGGRVGHDVDADGTLDSAEPGLVVGVELIDSQGLVVSAQVTGTGGGYYFGNLAADTYTVIVNELDLPQAFTPSFDFDGLGSLHTATVPLGSGNSATGTPGIPARAPPLPKRPRGTESGLGEGDTLPQRI